MKRKQIYVFEYTGKSPSGYEFTIGHNAYVGGVMADGSKTWCFDEMNPDGVYLARRKGGTLYLVRQ